MKVFLKFLILSSCSLLSLNCLACGYYPLDNECRITSFDANFLNFNELNAFVLNSNYLNGYIINEKYNWSQNIDQWYTYCNSNKISKPDIYKALYSNSIYDTTQNSFIKYIKENKKEAYFYLKELLNFEENTDALNDSNQKVFNEKWDAFSVDDYYYSDYNSGVPISIEFDFPKVLKNISNCKDAFIQKRWAYQALITAYYQGKPEIVKELFNKNFTSKNRTWIDNSAQHYFALVSENRNELMLDCIIHGYDKLTRNLELLTFSDGFDDNFAKTLNDTTRSYYYFVKCVREYGRGLPLLKKIFALNPKNKYFDFLLNREINKLEDWLQHSSVVSNETYFIDQSEYDESTKENIKNDMKYANDFLNFVKSIKEKSLFHDLLIVYTEHLLNIKNHKFNPEDYKKIKNQYVQARVIDFLINFEQKFATGKYKNDLLYIFNNATYLDKDENSNYWYLNDVSFMREQLARNLGSFMTKFPNTRAEGYLLTGKSTLPKNEWYPFFGMSLYETLYKEANIEDCIAIVNILNKKSNDKYIKFLQEDEKKHEKIHYCNSFIGSPEGQYDPIKILDIVAQKYVCQEKFEEAIAIYEKFPKNYWYYACEEMPFVLNINNAHNPFGIGNVTSFNKLTFLKQLLDYKKELTKNPENVLVNYYVANAYYSMTDNGCFWYIAKPYTSCDSYEEAKESAFYKKSIFYFKKVIQNSNDPKIVSTSLKTLNWLAELNKNELNKRNLQLFEKIKDNCDLYVDYLNSLSRSFKSTVHKKPSEIKLVKFVDFENVYYY